MSVRYASVKSAFFGCFWPRWDPILNQMIDKHVLRDSFTTLVISSVCLSICLSKYVTCSIHTETQPGRIVARSGLFLFVWFLTQKISSICLSLEYLMGLTDVSREHPRNKKHPNSLAKCGDGTVSLKSITPKSSLKLHDQKFSELFFTNNHNLENF